MIEKIKNFIKSLFPSMSYEYCYTDREKEGYAAMNCCGGLAGGTIATEYLSEQCIGCPYLVLIDGGKNDGDEK